jgi:hypothetical protein
LGGEGIHCQEKKGKYLLCFMPMINLKAKNEKNKNKNKNQNKSSKCDSQPLIIPIHSM